MKIESYSIDHPIEGLSKQYAIWISDSERSMPLVYLQRPKWIKDDEAWERVVLSIHLNLFNDIEIN